METELLKLANQWGGAITVLALVVILIVELAKFQKGGRANSEINSILNTISTNHFSEIQHSLNTLEGRLCNKCDKIIEALFEIKSEIKNKF